MTHSLCRESRKDEAEWARACAGLFSSLSHGTFASFGRSAKAARGRCISFCFVSLKSSLFCSRLPRFPLLLVSTIWVFLLLCWAVVLYGFCFSYQAHDPSYLTVTLFSFFYTSLFPLVKTLVVTRLWHTSLSGLSSCISPFFSVTCMSLKPSGNSESGKVTEEEMAREKGGRDLDRFWDYAMLFLTENKKKIKSMPVPEFECVCVCCCLTLSLLHFMIHVTNGPCITQYSAEREWVGEAGHVTPAPPITQSPAMSSSTHECMRVLCVDLCGSSSVTVQCAGMMRKKPSTANPGSTPDSEESCAKCPDTAGVYSMCLVTLGREKQRNERYRGVKKRKKEREGKAKEERQSIGGKKFKWQARRQQ